MAKILKYTTYDEDLKLLPGKYKPGGEIDFTKYFGQMKYIYLPWLITAVHQDTNFSPEYIKGKLVELFFQTRSFTFERTSLVFITTNGPINSKENRRRLRLYPIFNNAYCSHILLR